MIQTRMEILLIGMCALMWALIGTTAATTWCVDDDGGADFVRISREVAARSCGRLEESSELGVKS